MDEEILARETLAKRIAGEVVLSDTPGKIIQKWRNIFKIPQRKLANEMKIMPSVISDYENGRRKSPGIKVIKKMVDAMINIDEKRGGRVIKEFSVYPNKNLLSEAIIDMKEFSSPITITDFCKSIDAKLSVRIDLSDKKIYGYTIVDSMKAIIDIPPMELVRLYGMTSERAIIFVGSKRGRSAMVAIKVTNLRPGLVILQSKEGIDELAKRIAEIEGIPIATTKVQKIKELMLVLKRKYS
jgi:putative transcriptional regulator